MRGTDKEGRGGKEIKGSLPKSPLSLPPPSIDPDSRLLMPLDAPRTAAEQAMFSPRPYNYGCQTSSGAFIFSASNILSQLQDDIRWYNCWKQIQEPAIKRTRSGHVWREEWKSENGMVALELREERAIFNLGKFFTYLTIYVVFPLELGDGHCWQDQQE